MVQAMYVRFQSAVPNARGAFPGVFALVNGLARHGLLTSADQDWVRRANADADDAYPDPSTTDPLSYDPTVHPGARAWFRQDAHDLLRRTEAYLDLLSRYEVPWMELRTASPGRIVYADLVQVVAVPGSYPDDWRLGPMPG